MLLLAVAIAGATVAEFTTGSVHVTTAVAGVEIENALWPAYIGLLPGGCVVVGASAQLVVAARAEPATPRGAAHGTAA